MQQSWIDSYNNEKHRKMLFPQTPTGVGNIFLDYLRDNNYSFEGDLLDVACGNGRNAFALAELGFNVFGVDGIPQAIDDARSKATELNLEEKTEFVVGDLGDKWPYGDDRFDYAIDSNSFSSLLLVDRNNYTQELPRVMKSGGLFFLYTYTIDDLYYAQFIPDDNNDDPVQIHCPDDKVDRLLHSQKTLIELFSSDFNLAYEYTIIRYGKMFDEYYKRNFATLIFQKK